MTRRSIAAVSLLLLTTACTKSSSSPTSPTSGSSSTPSSWTLAGEVVATSGSAVGGAAVSFAGQQASTDAAGRFTIQHQSASSGQLLLSHPSLLDRRIWLRGGTSRTDLTLEPIALVAPFDLAFYRQMIRNAFEGTGQEPLRRWTVAPKFYVRTTEDNGTAIDGDTLARVREGLNAGVAHYSPLDPPHIETGPEDRPESNGWIIVRLHRRWQSGDPCGQATVGGNQGWISLYMDNCRCPGERSRMAVGTVMHEVGHSMGFWHVSERPHILSVPYACGRVATEKERFHTRIAYRRPVGNTDPDNDPSTAFASTAEAAPVVVSCHP